MTKLFGVMLTASLLVGSGCSNEKHKEYCYQAFPVSDGCMTLADMRKTHEGKHEGDITIVSVDDGPMSKSHAVDGQPPDVLYCCYSITYDIEGP